MSRTLKTITIDDNFSEKELEQLLLDNYSNLYYITFRGDKPKIDISLHRPRVMHTDCLEHTVCMHERGKNCQHHIPLKKIVEVCLIVLPS